MENRLGPKGRDGQRRMPFLFLLPLFYPALSEQIRYTIPEELPRGSVVGNLAKDLGLGVRNLPTRNLRVSAEKKFFTVSTENGDLLVSDRIDREEICGKKPTCVLEFEMVAEKPFDFFHVTVVIQDINDNSPAFSRNITELEISELALTGATFALESAQDSDVGVNSLRQYDLSPDPHFSLIQKENPEGSSYPELVVKASLDREEQSFHHLVLTAVDGGEPARSCTTQIRVVVADANDNPPMFTQDMYMVSVPESLQVGSSVLKVMATDADEGVNAEITYSFINIGKRVGHLFKLDSKTGELTTAGGLDFEERESYTIGVQAKDGGRHTAHCKIRINILDENDNVPEITLDSESKHIQEDAELGTVIALIKTHDPDSGFNGEILCQLQGKFPFKIVQETKNTYKLVTEGALDREQTPEYNVTITATDRGKPPLSSNRTVTLIVADVNDNAPVFQQASYVVHVAENNPPGASIAQVSASDPDLGPNGHVSYSIVASDLEPRALWSYVSVSAQSGAVFAQRAFDHEQLRAFELTLQARDQGSPALGANVSLRVLVGDRNDNAPTVLYPALGPDGSALFDTVPRAAQPGYLVTKVVAVDADSGHNAWLSYHVLQASEPGLFSLGLRTGEVRTARALGDRDAARQRLLVAVRDGGQPPLSATATLHLVFADSLHEALPDLSDRPAPADPQAELQFYLVLALALISVLFLLAVILAVALSLRCSSSHGAWSCFPTGVCSKAGPGILPSYSEGTLPYSYNLRAASHSSKTELKFLSIKPEGVPPEDLLCNEAFWFESTNNGNPASNGNLKMTSSSVSLQQGNAKRAVMVSLQKRRRHNVLVMLFTLLGMLSGVGAGQIRYSIPEELDKGSLVGNIAKDLGLEPRELAERGVRIVSRGRTQLFALNARSGSLVTAGRIDREELCAQSAPCLVSFNILVEDKLNLYPVEVEIVDINDNTPQFAREEFEVKILENAAPFSRFPLMDVYDPDVGMNSLRGFKLSGNSHFSVDISSETNGPKYPELVLEHSLDRERETIHHLVLTAMDGGDPVRSGTARILVNVLDVNDNAPVFTQSVYHVSVPEDLPVGTPVLSVNATDQDEGAHAEVMYSFMRITEKISKNFCLNVLTGEISTSANLDYEDLSFYELDVEAQDRPGLRDRAKVLITILDVNDNVPEVVVTSGSRSVAESTPPGTVIALFQVCDRDSGLNGLVTCSISKNLPFDLEKSVDNYYRLVTNTVLDREQVSLYNITVTATDKGIPPLSTKTLICLNVADTNDNPPTFSQSSYSIYVPENNPRGASIFSVTAHDPDSHENARVTYSLSEDSLQGASLSSYVSINSDTGVLYALHAFDYEQFRDLQLRVTALDSGDPPLSSNVSLSLFVLDKNDNAPEILYPTLPTDGSTGVELAPRSAEPGYLVTKVVAVDRDSGQNAWLSYRLLKASEPGLFAVGLHTGEVRTARALLDRDALKQSLVVAVQDHGQPPLSATVTLTVAVADSIPDVLADLDSMKAPADPDASGLTLYLVVAVAAVSCVFLAFVIVLLALRLRRWHASRLLPAVGGGLVGVGASPFVGVDGVRAFLQTYSHEVSLTADSRESHVIFPQPNYADTLVSQESCAKSEPLLAAEDSGFCKVEESLGQQAPPNTDWRFSQAQRPGTSGSQNGDETGTWPNNQFDTEMLQAMILASASEAADGSSTLGGGAGTMGLSARYGPQFTLQHVPDYRQNVYIPGSNATLTNAAGKRDGKAPAGGNGNKKKSGKKEKK
ncbi:protocadherin gamma-A6 isoform X1 [Manis javanica]|uniref:protocadherin gamma-A6 isoform X1 n=1 Tax=Manis javanica TaxID=9974 RepID=UPI003C6D2754